MSDKKTLDLVAEVKAVNAETREVLHTISTPTPDRAGDVVLPDGANIENYKRNPVVLLDHDYTAEKIIGRGEVFIEKGSIEARTRFAETPLARDMFELVKSGFAKAWSIGFKPVKFSAITDEKGVHKGFKYSEWELLEYSLVAIGMNPEAVTQALRGVRILRATKGVHPETIKYLTGAPTEPAPCSKEQPADVPNVPEPCVNPITLEAFAKAERILRRGQVASTVSGLVDGLLRSK